MTWESVGFGVVSTAAGFDWEFPFTLSENFPLDTLTLKIECSNGIQLIEGKKRYPGVYALIGRFIIEPDSNEQLLLDARKIFYKEDQPSLIHFPVSGSHYDGNLDQYKTGLLAYKASPIIDDSLVYREGVKTQIGIKTCAKVRGVKRTTYENKDGELVIRYPWWTEPDDKGFNIQLYQFVP